MAITDGATAGVESPPVQLYTPEEAGGILRVCRSVVYDLMRTGELGSVVVGARRRLIPADSIRNYVAQRVVTPIAAPDDGG